MVLEGHCIVCIGAMDLEGAQKKTLEPYSLTTRLVLAIVYFCARRYDQLIEQCKKTLELDPDFAQAHFDLGVAYVEKFMHEAAIIAFQRGVDFSRGASMFLAGLGGAYATAKQSDKACTILKQLQQLARQQYVSPYMVARLYVALGKRDEAFHWLEEGYRERAALMLFLKTDSRFDPLRSDPRFQDILQRMNFPE